MLFSCFLTASPNRHQDYCSNCPPAIRYPCKKLYDALWSGVVGIPNCRSRRGEQKQMKMCPPGAQCARWGGRYHLPGDLFPYRTPLPPTVVSFTYCSFIPLLQSQISLFNLLLYGVVEVVEELGVVRLSSGGLYERFALLKDGFFQWGELLHVAGAGRVVHH